jgi:hypothetical protein
MLPNGREEREGENKMDPGIALPVPSSLPMTDRVFQPSTLGSTRTRSSLHALALVRSAAIRLSGLKETQI